MAAEIEKEVEKAKSYLQNLDTSKNISVYDHLCHVLKKVLTERPKNATALLETYISEGAGDKAATSSESRVDMEKQSGVAETNMKLFQKNEEEEEGGDGEEEFEIPLPNCMELAFFFEQAGIGLSREEMYKIFLSLKSLVFGFPLTKVRFWGKILGINANYIIAEVEFNEGEGDEEETEEEQEAEAEEEKEDGSEADGPSEEDELPKSTWKPPPVVPKEDHHSGANKKVYFVCNEPGEAWVKLPHVTPAQISAARLIRKMFTGNLEAPVTSYPPFPGNESNLLRAQLTRISAATQISPAGFYMFDEDEDEGEEEESVRETFMENQEFEGISLKDLSDASMNSWVHHSQDILPQGRCSWWNPHEKPEEDFSEEDLEEEEEEETTQVKPETGATLLSSVAEDRALGPDLPAWSTYISSRVLPEYAVSIARSNRWPGAYAFGKVRRFENVYIGWGQKYNIDCYTPPCPPDPAAEYADGQEVMEIEDPSVEEEQLLKQRQEEAAKAADDMDQMEEEEEDD